MKSIHHSVVPCSFFFRLHRTEKERKRYEHGTTEVGGKKDGRTIKL